MFDLWRYGKITRGFDNQINESDEVSFDNIKKYLGDSADVVYKKILAGDNLFMPVVFIDGLVNVDLFDITVLKPLRLSEKIKESKSESEFMRIIADSEVYHINFDIRDNIKEVLNDILTGSVAIISDYEKKAAMFELKGFQARSLSEPSNEAVIKGPKNAFIEVIRTNTALIRRCIRSVDLKIDNISAGRTSPVSASIVYMGSITDENLVGGIREKIESMDCENISSIGDFEERLLGRKNSVFPRAVITERPDKFCSNIMEGKIGVIVDGFPTAIIVPAVLNMYFQAPDDYSNNYAVASFVRILRYFCAVIALTLPALYISVVCYHPGMLNDLLTLSVINNNQDVSLSSIQEVIFLMLAFEILMEAGIRMPRTIGQAVPIIGGLIIGDAAVSAKLISPLVVIAAAVTGIAGFMIPNQEFFNSIRICRYIFIAGAVFGGLSGVAFAAVGFIYYLCTIESFGVAYFAPFVSNEGKSLFSDTFIRKPHGSSKK
ncbi:MAG: spore germination protein [Oscillospiraceae bacterium]|nr:spore germination protein [Oscillospiraceae bacterium]